MRNMQTIVAVIVPLIVVYILIKINKSLNILLEKVDAIGTAITRD